MKRFLVLAAMAAAITGVAAAEEWRVTPLGAEGWSLREKGQESEPSSYTVQAVYAGEGTEFSIGCTYGYGLDISWKPSATLQGSGFVPVNYTINGELILSRQHVINDRNDYSWAEREGEALDLIDWMFVFESGSLVMSGGGVTDTVPFDEEAAGWPTELILASCGYL